jgi:hypothetical protein
VDEQEFEEMATRVIETNCMFTGAEAGRSFHRQLTMKQLDALINHKWPDAKMIEKDAEDPLTAVIQNIKAEKESKGKEGSKKNLLQKSQIDDDGLEGSKNARLTKMISIGMKLRSEGRF